MTNGTTKLEFKHDTASAVEASLDALALAITWADEGSQLRTELVAVQRELRAVRHRHVNTAEAVRFEM